MLLETAAAISGLIAGSFLNVVIARLPARQSIVWPGSRCPKCGSDIAWYDNLPLVSYALLRGRCRACRAAISPRYPIVEFLTSILFVAGALKFGWSWIILARDAPLVMILVAVTYIDLDHLIIPDELSLGGLAYGLATAYWDPRVGLLGGLEGAAVGFCIFYFFAWLYQTVSGRSGLGGGDIKLLAMLGAFLGLPGVFCVILISSVLGSVAGVGIALAAGLREKSAPGEPRSGTGGFFKLAIPYGPFLALGGMVYYLFGDTLWLLFTNQT